jgi:energy-coupling factor transporter ATP-binding protein EcfA2
MLSPGDANFTAARKQIDSIFKTLTKTQYFAAFRNLLNADPSGTTGGKNYYDLEMGKSFVGRWGRLKNGTRLEHALTARVKEDVRRMFGYESLEIDPWLGDQSLRLTINGRPYKLGEVGSGIAQLIVVLANAALAQPSYILIDEPELNLHPSLQSDFLTSLASYATEGVFYATHNAGLALSCADRIYTVRRNKSTSKVSTYEQTPRLSEFLGELGYAAYQDLGFDKILLVEGPTEVKLIGYWLRLYRLAHKVVLLHLGGSSLINGKRDAELQEIKRLSPNVFALIDSERDKADAHLPPDREAFVAACKRANIQCFVTERRATENYFSERAIETALGPGFSALTKFELLKKTSRPWSKNKNWRIGAEMTIEDLKDTDLHKLFTSLLGESH